MGDSIDLLRGVALATGYGIVGGVVGAVVDGVITGFTEGAGGSHYENREIRGVAQLAFSLASFGQVIELAAPANVDSPFAMTVGLILLLASQPRMMHDLTLMFLKVESAIFKGNKDHGGSSPGGGTISEMMPLSYFKPPFNPLGPKIPPPPGSDPASPPTNSSPTGPPATAPQLPPPSVKVPPNVTARTPVRL